MAKSKNTFDADGVLLRPLGEKLKDFLGNNGHTCKFLLSAELDNIFSMEDAITELVAYRIVGEDVWYNYDGYIEDYNLTPMFIREVQKKNKIVKELVFEIEVDIGFSDSNPWDTPEED